MNARSEKPRRARADAPHPFLRKRTLWARIPVPVGAWPQRSLKTSDQRVARDRCAMLRRLNEEGRYDVLQRLVDGSLDLVRVHNAYREQRLPAYLAEVEAAARDIDLEPHVEVWRAELRQLGVKSADDYLAKVRTLIPVGRPFRRSMLTESRLSEWLSAWSGGTRNRYRNAASGFVEYCIRRGLLTVNLVLAQPRAKEHGPRVRYLTEPMIRQLLADLPPSHRVLHAVLLASGGDLAATLCLKYRDVERRGTGIWEVRIPGTKKHTRDAVRRLLWPWAGELLEAHLAAMDSSKGAALLFGELLPDGTEQTQLKRAKDQVRHVLKATMKAGGLPSDYSTRDHRHSFAVLALRSGYRLEVVAKQLGHVDTTLTQKVYGKFALDDRDYLRATTLVPHGESESAGAPAALPATAAE